MDDQDPEEGPAELVEGAPGDGADFRIMRASVAIGLAQGTANTPPTTSGLRNEDGPPDRHHLNGASNLDAAEAHIGTVDGVRLGTRAVHSPACLGMSTGDSSVSPTGDRHELLRLCLRAERNGQRHAEQ